MYKNESPTFIIIKIPNLRAILISRIFVNTYLSNYQLLNLEPGVWNLVPFIRAFDR